MVNNRLLPITEWIQDSSGFIVKANDYFDQLFVMSGLGSVLGRNKDELSAQVLNKKNHAIVNQNDKKIAEQQERLIFFEPTSFGNFLSIKSPIFNDQNDYIGISGMAVNMTELGIQKISSDLIENIRHQLITPLSVIQQSNWLLTQLNTHPNSQNLNNNIKSACLIMRKNLEKNFLLKHNQALEKAQLQVCAPLYEVRGRLSDFIPYFHITSTQNVNFSVIMNVMVFKRIKQFINLLAQNGLDTRQLMVRVSFDEVLCLCQIQVLQPATITLSRNSQQQVYSCAKQSFQRLNATLEWTQDQNNNLTWNISVPITVTVFDDYQQGSPENILLVEDSMLAAVATRSIIKEVLPKSLVTHVENGVDAIDKINHNNYDLVLLDIDLPDIDGYAIASAIRKHPKSKCKASKVAFVSAHETQITQTTLVSLNVNAFYEKPLMPAQLQALCAS